VLDWFGMLDFRLHYLLELQQVSVIHAGVALLLQPLQQLVLLIIRQLLVGVGTPLGRSL
jgi:hypothetical protein